MRTLYGSTSWRRVLALVLVFVMMVSTMGTSGYSVFAEDLVEANEEVTVAEPEANVPEVTEDIQGPSPGEEESEAVVDPATDAEPVTDAELVEASEEDEEPADAEPVEATEEGEEPADAELETDAEPVEATEEGEEPADAETVEATEEAEPVEPAEETLISEAAKVIEGDDGEEVAEPETETVAEPVEATEEVVEEELPEEEILEEEVVMPAIDAEKLFDDARVTVSAPEGAFPEGTTVNIEEVTLGRTQVAAVANAVEETVVSYKAYDITFNNGDQTDMQPAEGYAVKVNIEPYSMPAAENLQVVHMEDRKTATVVESETTEDGLAFDAEHFSVYVVVETGTDARLKVEFVGLNNAEIKSIYVKKSDTEDAETFATVLYDPGTGSLANDVVFKGWTTDPDYTTKTAPLTIEGVRTAVAATDWENIKDADAEGGAIVTYYAMLFKTYKVDYLDEHDVSLGGEDITFRADEAAAKAYTVNKPYTPADNEHAFMGWLVKSGSGNISGYTSDAVYENGTAITITGSVTFSVNAPAGHWLVFDENGKNATYNAPQFVKSDAVTVKPSKEMVKNGFTFGGWYYFAEGVTVPDPDPVTKIRDLTNATEFKFGDALTDKLTIYAKWTQADTANYTILIWKENLAGDGYDFEESVTLSGNVGDTITTVSQSGTGDDAYAVINETNYNSYTGFHLDSFDQNVKINVEGNSVVNVYYKRTVYTLTFQARSGGGPGGGNWRTVATITEKYGTRISSNFPLSGYENYAWQSQGGTTFEEGYNLVNIDVMPAENVTFRGIASGSSFKMNYWLQPTTLSTNYADYELLNSITAYNGGVLTYNEDFLEVSGFIRAGSNPAFRSVWGYDGEVIPHEGLGTMTVDFYYNRALYKILLMDGAYVDGDGNPIEEANRGQIGVWDNIAYGADISSYENVAPAADKIPTGYVFEGWYLDSACTHEYPFGSMPQGGLTLYAKWRQIQYRVFLHPNVPSDDTSLDWGSDKQALNFRRSYRDTVSLPTGLRSDYEFAGWYKDAALTESYNENTQLTEDTVKTDYNKETDFTDPMDKYGNGATWNSDIIGNNGGDRFWITKKLDLYAAWSAKVQGAKGIGVVYDVNGGTANATDTTTYKDNTNALTVAAPKAPNGKVFDHWVLQHWNGTAYVDDESRTYYPGEAFKVLKADAKVLVYEWANGSDETAEGYDVITVEKPEPGVTPVQEGYDVIKTATYTVQLKAVYKDVEDAQPTFIPWYKNDGSTFFHVDKLAASETDVNKSTLLINEAVKIQDAPEYDGYKFLGWARVSMGNTADAASTFMSTADNRTQSALINPSSLDNIDMLVFYNEDDGKFYREAAFTNVATQVAADESTPYQAIFAVLEEDEVTINYAVAEGCGSMGSVDPSSETIFAMSGEAVGSTATANVGYVFVKWTCNDGTDAVGTNNVFTPSKNAQGAYESHTYYAHFEEATYTLTYQYTGSVPAGVTAPTGGEHKYGDSIGAAPTPEPVTDYVFKGWDKAEAFTMPAEDVTITGTWAEDKNNNQIDDQEDRFKVVYDLQGGTTESEATEFSGLKVGDQTPTITAPTKIGSTFGGWQPTVQATVRAEDAKNSEDKLTITYTAQWTEEEYTLTYEYTGSVPAGVTAPTGGEHKYGDSISAAPTPDPVTDYVFKGWDKAEAFTMPAEDVTITGTWAEDKNNNQIDDQEDRFKVVYDLQGGTTESEATEFSGLKVGADTPTIENPTKSGYNFSGWQPTVQTTVRAEDAKNSEDKLTITYTAQWTEAGDTPYTVKHFKQDEVGSEKYTEVETDRQNLTGKTGTTATAEAKKYDGYTFDSNNTKNVPTGTIAADGSLVLELYYKVDKISDQPNGPDDPIGPNGTPDDEDQYTIRFVDYDDKLISSAKYAWGTEADKIAKPADPTREGYTFTGWKPEIVKVEGPATYKAQYEPITYTIIYHSNYQSVVSTETEDDPIAVEGATTIVTFNDVLGPNNQKFSKTSPWTNGNKTYTFAGWKDANGKEYPLGAYNGAGAILEGQTSGNDQQPATNEAGAVNTATSSLRSGLRMAFTTSFGGTLELWAQWTESTSGGGTNPRPRPNNPDPTDEPEEPIDDPDTPLAPGTIDDETEIDDGETPLAPGTIDEETEIDDEATPLTPFTGDDRHTAVWGFVSLLSLAGIVVVARKRREEE